MQTQVIISQATSSVTGSIPLSPEEKLVVKELEDNADKSSTSSDSDMDDLNYRLVQAYVSGVCMGST